MVNCVPGIRSNGIGALNLDASVNHSKVGLGVSRQIFSEFDGEDAGPDRGCDGRPYATTNTGKHALNGENDSDVLMGGGSHDGNLLTDDKGSTGESDEDLAHNNISNLRICVTEGNHAAAPEDGQRNTEVKGKTLEAASPADEYSDQQRKEARTDAIDVGDIGCLGDGEVVDHNEERVEVAVPDVKLHEKHGSQNTGTHYGSV